MESGQRGGVNSSGELISLNINLWLMNGFELNCTVVIITQKAFI